MAACVFCPEVARKRSAINVHLDHYVPEIAKARKLKPLTDNQHHVPTIRHGRYPARGMWDLKNQPPQKDWKLETDPLLKLFFVEFGKRMIVPINKVCCCVRLWSFVRFCADHSRVRLSMHIRTGLGSSCRLHMRAFKS